MLSSTPCLTVLVIGLACTLCDAAMRSWTASDGRKVEAEFVGTRGDSVMLKLASGQTVPYPMDKLSEEDRAFIHTQVDANRLPVEKRLWPDQVEVSAKSIEIAVVSENADERKYLYQSEAFEFTSQAKIAASVMKEVARTFEATRSLVNALPWGVVCKPPQGRPRFIAALYETRDDYQAAGGPPLSGGVYSSGDKIFKIPFESLGMEKRGQTYFKNDNYSNGTLVHEITHQLMDDYLPFLPKWIIEGTAEYTEMLPYKTGVFRAGSHKNGLKEDVKLWEEREGFQLEIPSLQSMMTMSRDAWDAECSTAQKMRDMYHRSQLLVYFFCHLDGDGRGLRFIQFMEGAYSQVSELRAFFADPRVKRMEGGRFSYPRDFPPPDMDSNTAPFKNLQTLLAERPYEKLSREIMDAYKTIGVKVTVKP